MAEVPSNHFGTGVDVLADILTNSKFDPKEIDTERVVISGESQMICEDAGAYVGQLYDRLIWGDSHLGCPIGGTHESIRNFLRKDFINTKGAALTLPDWP